MEQESDCLWAEGPELFADVEKAWGNLWGSGDLWWDLWGC